MEFLVVYSGIFVHKLNRSWNRTFDSHSFRKSEGKRYQTGPDMVSIDGE